MDHLQEAVLLLFVVVITEHLRTNLDAQHIVLEEDCMYTIQIRLYSAGNKINKATYMKTLLLEESF